MNISKIPQEEIDNNKIMIQKVYAAFGRNTAFSSVALGPVFNPRYCKNVVYTLKKN